METNFYKNLKKLLGHKIVIRHKDNKTVVKDFDNIQMAKDVNRYDNIYQKLGDSGTSNYRLNQYGYLNIKLLLFRLYLLMDRLPIPSSILLLLSLEVIAKNLYGNVLNIKSDDLLIVLLLLNLFYDILDVLFNLPSWVRNACKYGDCYLFLKTHQKWGITGAVPLSVYNINRHLLMGLNNFLLIYFTSTLSSLKILNYLMAHFRILTDNNYLPYGKSVLEGARKTWKMLCLLEDAMLIHKIMRAPLKRIFNVQVGNLPAKKTSLFMKQFKDNMKKVPFIDPDTNDYNLRYNLMNLTEDFFIPKRGQNDGNSILTLNGFLLSFVLLLDYLRKKFLSSFRVPVSYLGFLLGINAKATLASLSVRFARTILRIQRMISALLLKIALVHLYCHGYKNTELLDFLISLNNPSIIYLQLKLALWQDKYNLIQTIQQTELHSQKWMCKNILNMSDLLILLLILLRKKEVKIKMQILNIANLLLVEQLLSTGFSGRSRSDDEVTDSTVLNDDSNLSLLLILNDIHHKLKLISVSKSDVKIASIKSLLALLSKIDQITQNVVTRNKYRNKRLQLRLSDTIAMLRKLFSKEII